MAGGNLPWLLVRAMICERFHIPPSVLDAETTEIIQMWHALNKYEEHRKH